MTASVASKALGCSVRTFRRRVADGALPGPARRIGGVSYWRGGEIRARAVQSQMLARGEKLKAVAETVMDLV